MGSPDERMQADAILASVAHRPWPLPNGPWIMRQSWRDFLFCHWPMPMSALRPLVPPELELETWDGTCWLGILPFHMSGVTLRGFPDVPRFSAFPELNVRTYVRAGGKHGIFFLSLEAHNRLAVFLARKWYLLPYFYADMACEPQGDAIAYRSQRVGGPAAAYSATYRPTGPAAFAVPGTFEHWLCERYALYVADGRGQLWRGDVHHPPWPVQPAEIELRENTMAASHGLVLPDTAPHVMYGRRVDVLLWRLTRA